MPQPLIRADYVQLEQVAQSFEDETQRVVRICEAIDLRITRLKRDGWIADAADEFYRGMDNDVMPALQRLGEALKQGAYTTRDIIRIMKEAEEEAAACLHGDSDPPFEKDDGRRYQQIFEDPQPPFTFGETGTLVFLGTDEEPITIPSAFPDFSDAEIEQALADQFMPEGAINWNWFQAQPKDQTADNALFSSYLNDTSRSSAQSVTMDGGGWLALVIASIMKSGGWAAVAAIVLGKLLAEELRSSSQSSELAQAILAFSNDEPLYTPGGRRISGHAWENMYDPADRQPISETEVDSIIDDPDFETTQGDGRKVYIRRDGDEYSVVVIEEGEVDNDDYSLPEDTIVTVQSGFDYREIVAEARKYGWENIPPQNL